MPKKDGTGPDGKGSKTGRGLGRCNPDSSNADPMGQRGRGSQGPGRGAGGGGGGQGAGKNTGRGAGGGKGRGRGGRR